MSLENDYSSEDVKTMLYELKAHSDCCYYDEHKKKIVYKTANIALKIYCEMQINEINKHKWIESEKNHQDCGNEKVKEWVNFYSGDFRSYWRRTHLFIENN